MPATIELNEKEQQALGSIQSLFFSQTAISNAYVKLSTVILETSDPQLAKNKNELIKVLGELFSTSNKSIDKNRQIELENLFAPIIDGMSITDPEKQNLKLILHNRIFFTEQTRRQGIEALKHYSPETLLHFSEAIPSFKEFCETNTELEKTWSQLLKNAGQLGEKLVSPDKKIVVSVFRQFIGTYILNQLEELKLNSSDDKYDSEWLAKGCELKLYQALAIRCDFNTDKLRDDKSLALNKDILNEISQDTENLKAYWAMGYFRAGQMFLNLADAFVEIQEQQKASEYHQKSMESFAFAYLLEQHPISQKILTIYNEGETLPPENENTEVLIVGTDITDSLYQEIRAQQELVLKTLVPSSTP